MFNITPDITFSKLVSAQPYQLTERGPGRAGWAAHIPRAHFLPASPAMFGLGGCRGLFLAKNLSVTDNADPYSRGASLTPSYSGVKCVSERNVPESVHFFLVSSFAQEDSYVLGRKFPAYLCVAAHKKGPVGRNPSRPSVATKHCANSYCRSSDLHYATV